MADESMSESARQQFPADIAPDAFDGAISSARWFTVDDG
jgi:hypothetical protein